MRSQLLTILCIFSFISCGWGLVESGIALSNPERVANTTSTGTTPGNDPSLDRNDPNNFYEDRGTNADNPTPEDPRLVGRLSLGQFVYSLVTLLGAVLMFRLRRIGFYIYLLGVVLGFVFPLMMAGFAGLNTSFGAFFSVLFAVLYGFCLREMK